MVVGLISFISVAAQATDFSKVDCSSQTTMQYIADTWNNTHPNNKMLDIERIITIAATKEKLICLAAVDLSNAEGPIVEYDTFTESALTGHVLIRYIPNELLTFSYRANQY